MITRPALMAALLASAILAGPAVAQTPDTPTSRAAAIAAEQAEKATRLLPQGPSRAEQFVVRYVSNSRFLGGKLRGFYPWAGSVFGGSGAAFGAGYFKKVPGAAHLNALAGVSINGSSFGQVDARLPEIARGRVVVDVLGRLTNARAVKFYGLGQDTSKASRLTYDYTPVEFGATATVRPAHWLAVSAHGSRLGIETRSDASVLQAFPSPAPALGTDLSYNVYGATAAIDTRPSPAYSTRGTHLAARFARYSETEDRPFSFDRWEYEASQLVPLVREQYVLAFRAWLSTTTTNGGGEVPLMLQPYLGSGDTLRGFGNRRFTDRQAVVVTAEYRWRPSRYLDLALFVDAGQVASSVRAVTLDGLETDWGIGARFHGPAFSAFRVEVARGREGVRLVFAASPPF